MQVSLHRARVLLAVGLALILASLAFGARQAHAAYPGQICLTAVQSDVFERLDGPGWIYTLPAGAGFKIVGYWSSGGRDYYTGHGNGKPDGITDRGNINQATCVWP